jgi:hypothetical protein
MREGIGWAFVIIALGLVCEFPVFVNGVIKIINALHGV